MQPYKRSKEDYNSKMYQQISTDYCNYIKLFIKLSLKISILQAERNKMKEEAVTTSTGHIIDHQKHFMTVIGMITEQFKNSGFCKQTRLFSNYVFCLLKDLLKLYKVLEIYNMELLERFGVIEQAQMTKAFDLLQEFIETTKNIKKVANKLIAEFEFPKQLLPTFYSPEEGLLDTLKVIMGSSSQAPQ